MIHLLARFVTYIKGGGVLTFVGTRTNQAVHWEALVYDPFKDSYWPPVGGLAQPRTHTDKTSLTTNVYTAPKRHPLHRWGTGYLWGEVVNGQVIRWTEEWEVNDHIRVKWND